MRHALPFLCGALVLAACTKYMKEEEIGPRIDELSKQQAPAPEKLPIQESAPVATDPNVALENYRKILELAPDPETKAEAMRRLADLNIVADDIAPTAQSTQSLKESIALYEQLLAEHPDSQENDRVLYQMARAYQNVGDTDRAVEVLKRLSTQFPESRFTADGRFRRAELLFRIDRFDEAETEYRAVMDMAEKTPFFEAAQYKYGWALYKQSKYDQALEVFFSILDRDLPPGELDDPEKALAGVARGKQDLAKDVLRVASLTFAGMGGGQAINETIARRGAEPRYATLLYNALGQLLLEKERYSDAAKAYAAFTTSHPNHVQSPAFQTKVIAAYRQGNFSELVVQEKERYAVTYDPAAPYWANRAPTAEVLGELRTHLEDLGRYYQARAQKAKGTGTAASPDFLVAAKWYRRIIDVYPRDPRVPELNFLLADALYDGGRTLDAAREYTKTAYDYPAHAKSGESAHAAVLAYQRLTGEVPPANRTDALRQAVAAGVRFADSFPSRPEVPTVLTRASEDLFLVKDYAQAIAVANRVIAGGRATPELRRTAWGVIADAEFVQNRFGPAEKAYTETLQLVAATDPNRPKLIEQLAASIYKQGEAARAAGKTREAVDHFLRVARVTPGATIRGTAEYDAAAGLIQLEDWPMAAQVLERFRSGYPQDKLIPDVDKKLAVVYERDKKPAQAAAAYQRIAARSTESADTRREASWKAAKLFDDSKDFVNAAKAYEFYIAGFPQPLDPALDARERLMQIYRQQGNQQKFLFWLNDIVAADARAGAQRSDRSKTLAAKASLELGRLAARDVQLIRLSQPLSNSIKLKRTAMEKAIEQLSRAAGYGIADVTTASTFELGAIYQSFGKSIMDSDRPRNLDALELEQYNLLLEEQAFPFEEKAIETYEANLKRIRQGVFDSWVQKSYQALLQIAPAKYGRKEIAEETYSALR